MDNVFANPAIAKKAIRPTMGGIFAASILTL
jgi:hypothetical protein